jgi:plastocyanin
MPLMPSLPPTRASHLPSGHLVAGLLIGAGLAAAAVLTGCSSSGKTVAASTTASTASASTASSSTASASPGSSTAPGSSSTSSTAPPAGPDGVNIANYAFNPKTLSVKAGTTVTWKNDDQFAHQVTSTAGDPGAAFDLGQQAGGATVHHTFTTPGTYHYYCNIHNYMTGTIVVTP